MPRRARQLSSTGIYHVMLRGVNRATIFHDEEDNEVFLQKLEGVRKEYPFDLYAWCLMGNHVHLLVRVGAPGVLRETVPISHVPCEIETVPCDRPSAVVSGDGFFFTAEPGQRNRLPMTGAGALSPGSWSPGGLRETVPISHVPCEIETVPSDQVGAVPSAGESISLASLFKRFGVRYAAWYNHKYQRTGHLFQDRFLSKPVESDTQFLATLRYIVRNPIKAGLSREPGEYRWCGWAAALPVDASQEQLLRYFREADGDTSEPFPERLTDAEAERLLRDLLGGRPVSELVRMPKPELVPMLRRLQDAGANALQISRLTGISKSNVARWLSS